MKWREILLHPDLGKEHHNFREEKLAESSDNDRLSTGLNIDCDHFPFCEWECDSDD